MILSCVIPCYLLSVISTTAEGRLFYYHIGDNASLWWTLDPIPSVEKSVNVIHPSGSNLFIAREKLYLESGAFRDRVDFTGDTSTGNINFTLKNVTDTDAGEYSVNYDNTYYAGITLVIYVKPSTPTIVAGTPVQGSDLGLVCSAQSTSIPANKSLTMTYRWYINGTRLPDETRYVQRNQNLTIKNIQKSDNGTGVTCTAEETLTLPSNMSLEYIIIPEYGPETVSVVPVIRSYFIVVHSQLNPITCNAECYPGCTFQWQHNGTIVSTTNRIKVENAKEQHSGIYYCTATNQYGSMVSNEIIVVVLCKDVETVDKDVETVSTKGDTNVSHDGPNTASVILFVLSGLFVVGCIIYGVFTRLRVSPIKIKTNKTKTVSSNISDHYVDIDRNQEITVPQRSRSYRRLSHVTAPATYETLRPVVDHQLTVEIPIIVVESSEGIVTRVDTDREDVGNSDILLDVNTQRTTSNILTEDALHSTDVMPLVETQMNKDTQLNENKTEENEIRNTYLTPVRSPITPSTSLRPGALHTTDVSPLNQSQVHADSPRNEKTTVLDETRSNYLTPVSNAITSSTNIQTVALHTTVIPLKQTQVHSDSNLDENKTALDQTRNTYLTPVSPTYTDCSRL